MPIFNSISIWFAGAYTKYEGVNTRKKTYVTEFGWSTAYVSQQTQANNLATAYGIFEGTNSYVPMAIWFNWQDSPGASLYFGILDQNGNPKTAYANYQFYQQYEGYYASGTVETNILNYFNTRGQAAMGDAFDNGLGAFVHYLSGGDHSALAQDFAGGSHQNLTIFDLSGANFSTTAGTPWYQYPICVPFNDTNYDTQYGGSHDMDVQTPLGTPITSIVSGTVSSVDNPSWGWEIGIKLDTPIVNGNTNAEYFAYLHLGAVKPGLAVGQRVTVGELIAYSGGANSVAQLGSQTNTPFGPQFLDDPSQSSQPQTGIALMRGPEYGMDGGWTTLPDPTLDPTPTLNAVRAQYPDGLGPFEINDLHGFWSYYFSHGGIGTFGPPLDNEYSTTNGTQQDFAGGSLFWTPGVGVSTNPAAILAPFVSTGPATKISVTRANLDGLAVANGTNTSAWFEWGTNTSYGRQTALSNIGSGFQVAPFTGTISNLAAGTIYHYRLVGSNALGTTYGRDRRFTTGGRVKVWGADSLGWGYTNVPGDLTNVVAVAAGAYHALALRNDGTVVAWGYDNFGQVNVPTGLNNVVGIAAGMYHSLALRNDGTVVAWGYDNFGQTDVPTGLTNVVAVAAGAYHNLALKADGTVVAWGNNDHGQINVPNSLNNVVAIAAGLYHSLALEADGNVVAWGSDLYGQTELPANLTNVVAISAGENHNLALKADGKLVAWGDNNNWQGSVPAAITNVTMAACGEYFNLVENSNGQVEAWGDDSSGQTEVPGRLGKVAQLAGGLYFGLAVAYQLPLAQAETVWGLENHDLVIGLEGSVGDGNELSYRVSKLPGKGMLYQYMSGGRGSVIDVPDTVVSDAGGRVVFGPGTNETGAPYASFEYVVNDGLNDSAAATVVVNIGLPLIPQLGATAWEMETGTAFGLTFSGSSNATYSVWGSTNLLEWDRLGTAFEGPAGFYQFDDTTANNWPERFYRVSAP